jgi:hypothetical protein
MSEPPTLAEVIDSIEIELDLRFGDQPGGRIICAEPDALIVGRGTVLYCEDNMPPGYEEGTWLIVITDDTGTAAYTGATDMLDLHAWQGPGLFCRDLLALYPGDQRASALTYLLVLAYWFQDGEPDRMDADLNGIPCETLFDPAAVEAVWAGGYFWI